jgi:hypothetical protein
MRREGNAMIELTEDQRRELGKEDPVRVRDPQTNDTYVLVRSDVYERLRALLADDTVYTTADVLDRVMAEDDANDPYLADLQKQYGGTVR